MKDVEYTQEYFQSLLKNLNIGNSNRYSLVAWLKNKFGE